VNLSLSGGVLEWKLRIGGGVCIVGGRVGEGGKEERGEGVEVEQVITFFEAWKT
jgi:hypothetical protein